MNLNSTARYSPNQIGLVYPSIAPNWEHSQTELLSVFSHREETMKFLNVIGPQIRKLRYQRGWSQNLLATKLQIEGWDISRSGVAKVECRLVHVDDYRLFYFLRVFKVSFTDLLPPIDTSRCVHDPLVRLMATRR
jgi:hypothetical protein